jgi:PBSX family phage terminase large subunit
MAEQEREISLNWPPREDGPRGPSTRQAEFLRCGAREQLYGGSKRGGKTVAGAAKAIYLSFLFPGNRGLIARQAFTDLRDSTLVTFFSLCPPELIRDHNRSEHRITIHSRDPKHPSSIIYRGLGEDAEGGVSAQKAKEKAKAIETGWFWVDEPSEVAFDAYKMMLSQLCWFLPDGTRPPYMALLTSNPEPGWVKDRYVDSEHNDYIIGKPGVDATFIPSLPRDNPGLPPGWEIDLRATMNEDWVRRYLDGSWDIHEGMVFKELSDKIHNLDNYFDTSDETLWHEFVKGFRHIGALDHATTGVTAYLRVGIDTSENAFALGEYYQKDRRINEHAEQIKILDGWYGTPEYRLIDPSTEAKTLQNKGEMYSVQDAYIREGVSTLAAHRAQIGVGIDLIQEYLHVNPVHRNPFTQSLGSPRLFISKRRCPNLWHELLSLKTELKPDGTIVYSGTDHATDDLRHILMSRPQKAAKQKLDISVLPTLDQKLMKSFDKWSSKFGKTSHEGSWF